MEIHYPFNDVVDVADAKKLVTEENAKFVMVEDKGELITAIFEGKTTEHRTIALRFLDDRELADEDFKGAGWIEPAGPNYNSSSCLREFHRDKPKDAGEAERLLQALRTKLVEIGILEGSIG